MSTLFPVVPLVPGVPNVLRGAENALASVGNLAVMATTDAALVSNIFQAPQWGIFDSSGSAVIQADTVLAVDFRREYRVANAPQEDGAFTSYNKVQEPFDARVTFAYSGNGSIMDAITSGGFIGSAITGVDAARSRRGRFLSLLEAAVASTDLFSVYTPEIDYPSANIVHYDYRRETRSGVSMLTVDVWLQEVRVTGTTAFSNTAAPSGANLFNNGTVQAQAPTSAQSSVVQSGGVY